ncbi:MAG: linear amide C-N hydrolase [Treponema sp.]|nr:linear amide C-N hydrolase [Candidatus Treponema merdequi]
MKKISVLLLASALTASFLFAQTDSKIVRSEFTKVADYLYEVTYSDYDINFLNVKNEGVISYAGEFAEYGCSAIRHGNYLGRNLDLFYGEHCEVIVKVPAKDGRYASIGTLCGMKTMTDKYLAKGKIDKNLEAVVPLIVCDGINEKGLVVEVNVVPAADIGFTTGTNPSKPVLNMPCVARTLLDNAATAKEAVKIMQNRNICNPWDVTGLVGGGMEYHWMIADAKDTFVVEIINNRLTVTKTDISTNYYVGLKNRTEHSMGIERAEILKENAGIADSTETMAKLMSKVYFSKVNDVNAEKFCYSDHFGITAKDGTTVTYSNREKYKEDLLEAGRKDAEGTARMFKTKVNDNGYWITMHTIVFDIPNKKYNISVHEDEKNWYTYGF